MREILFRGKRTDTGEWVEGYLAFPYCKTLEGVVLSHVFYAIDEEGWPEQCVVIVDTIGQYTGLKDKNGKKIFEGDIIKSCMNGDVFHVRYFGDANYPAFDTVPETNLDCNVLSFLVNVDRIDVIGNIHDNPELMEVEA